MRRLLGVGQAKLLKLDRSEEAEDDPAYGRVGFDLAVLGEELGSLLCIRAAWHETANVAGLLLPAHHCLSVM